VSAEVWVIEDIKLKVKKLIVKVNNMLILTGGITFTNETRNRFDNIYVTNKKNMYKIKLKTVYFLVVILLRPTIKVLKKIEYKLINTI
tara:strand:- start:297 stop:560 length:264 start_codon:yes stop_codon:yes gene_type:complete